MNMCKYLLTHLIDNRLSYILQNPCVGSIKNKAKQKHQRIQRCRA